MILSIGEILFDVFPSYRRLGGAPYNFAFHLKMIGFPVRFISRVGNDRDGQRVKATLGGIGFDLQDIQTDPQRATGKVAIQLNARGVPDFTILPDAAYDNIDPPSPHGGLFSGCELIYYGTLAQRSQRGFSTIQGLLDFRPPGCKCFYDVNLRPDNYSARTVRTSLEHADILKLNEEELSVINAMVGIASETSAEELRHRYGIEMVALTRGSEGATLFTESGRYDAEAQPVDNLVDTVGAGDAFAAVLAAASLCRLPPDHIVKVATSFAARLCAVEGAIPGDRTIYSEVIQFIGKDFP